MSSAQRWQKIIDDTQNAELSDQQLFWRSVAQLRLGLFSDALQTFENLGSKQFSKIEFRLHATELYLKNNLLDQGQQLLVEIFPKLEQDTKESKQWEFIAKRYPKPKAELKLLLERVQRNKTIQNKSFSFPDANSWMRAQKLATHHQDPDFYLAWLDWTIANQTHEFIQMVLQKTLCILPNRGYLCYQLFERLKSKELWPEMIESLFPHHHRSSNQPELMWRQWHKSCPSEHLEKLKQAMLETQLRRPNQQLEQLITQLFQ